MSQPGAEQSDAAIPKPLTLGNDWLNLQGSGYNLQVVQFSNKGPLIIVNTPEGQEIGRARFDVATRQWKFNPTE